MAPEEKELTMSSTKKEMLQAYNELLAKIEQEQQERLQPEEKAAEQKVKKAVELADRLSLDAINTNIAQLKSEMNSTLGSVVEKMETELDKYQDIKKAIEAGEKELSEIFEIQKSASSLAALIEAQNQRRKFFEGEMEEKKCALEDEIEQTRKEWETEKIAYKAAQKEQIELMEKQRKRDQEEYEYSFKREQQISRNKFEDEKAKLEKELTEKKQILENELSEREKVVAEREKTVDALDEQIKQLEQQLDEDIQKTVNDTTQKLEAEFKSKESLSNKIFEGERNVLNAQIQSLEETVKKQSEQINQLTTRMEKAANQVQDIAVKAIEGSSQAKWVGQLQELLREKKKEVEVKGEK